MIDGADCGAISAMNEWQRTLKHCEETCLNAALSASNPTSFDPGWFLSRDVAETALSFLPTTMRRSPRQGLSL
jgi:hypothetical protein